MHDLVIGNACVFDGLGHDPLEESVGVRDGFIAEVGDDVDVGKETVDAEGLALLRASSTSIPTSTPSSPGTHGPPHRSPWV